jgi:hypothetical protein
MTITEIVTKYGISQGTVADLFHDMGIKPRGLIKRHGRLIQEFNLYHVEKMVKRYRDAVKKAEENKNRGR